MIDRIRKNIGEHSYIVTFNDEKERNFILFIHGILGNYKESWDKTPSTLMMGRGFVEFEYGSFGYESGIIDLSNTDLLIDGFILWCKTHLKNNTNIYIVTHSLGGLILRRACAKLYNSKKHEEWTLTNVDTYEGAVKGNHSSVKNDVDENSTLITRIASLINTDVSRTYSFQVDKINTVLVTNKRRGESIIARDMESKNKKDGIDVILISCSAHKKNGENKYYDKNVPNIVNCVSDPKIGKLIHATRLNIFSMIKEGRIDGIEFKEGNRAARPANEKLSYGPDFGGAINEKQFMPAHLRYEGRSYRASEKEWQEFIEIPYRPRILIMSGLYGLPMDEELIQNYDCHMTDVDENSGFNIQSYWMDRQLMTSILISHLEWIESNVKPINKIIDLLSELSYQETIKWTMIYHRWPVFHRVFEKSAGRDSLENIGVWLKDVICKKEQNIPIEHDVFYENANFFKSDRIAFEKRIGDSSLIVARETNQKLIGENNDLLSEGIKGT